MTHATPPALQGALWREYRFPLLLACAIVIVGSFPYLYAYWSQPAGEIFMGFVGRGTPGANGYFMFARQVQDGFHLTENLFTPEPLPRNYFNFEWWLTGMVAAWTGLSLEAVFHLDRILTVLGFCLSAYYLASLSIPSIFWRRIAVSLVCLGSGFGWLLLLAGRVGFELPLSLDVSGVQPFGYLVNKPHFMRAGLFAILTYAFVIQGLRSNRLGWFFLSGLMALCHSLIRPFHIIELHLVYVALPILLAWRDADWRPARFLPFALAAAVHAPAIAYYLLYSYLGTLGDLGTDGWDRAPGYLLEHILWTGWPLLALVLSLPWFLRLRHLNDSMLVLTAWVLAAWSVCQLYPYWELGLESVMFGYSVASPLLVCAGVSRWLVPWLARHTNLEQRWPFALRYRLPLTLALVAVALPSSAWAYRDMFLMLHRDHPQWTYYLPEPVYETLHWIGDNVPAGAVILASQETSQFIPRISHHKTVTGHELLTADYVKKNEYVSQFYSDMSENSSGLRSDIVLKYNVRYVVQGPLERRHGNPNLSALPWLERIHENGAVQIYAVNFDRMHESR